MASRLVLVLAVPSVCCTPSSLWSSGIGDLQGWRLGGSVALGPFTVVSQSDNLNLGFYEVRAPCQIS
jgi:hypothetical protein